MKDGTERIQYWNRKKKSSAFGSKLGGRRRWFNLTIENVHPSGSGGYTCVAQNEGGVAEGNVTVVYSETVATYLDKADVSSFLLVCAAVASGAVGTVFAAAILCLVVAARKRRRRENRRNSAVAVPPSATIVDDGSGSKDYASMQHVVLTTNGSLRKTGRGGGGGGGKNGVQHHQHKAEMELKNFKTNPGDDDKKLVLQHSDEQEDDSGRGSASTAVVMTSKKQLNNGDLHTTSLPTKSQKQQQQIHLMSSPSGCTSSSVDGGSIISAASSSASSSFRLGSQNKPAQFLYKQHQQHQKQQQAEMDSGMFWSAGPSLMDRMWGVSGYCESGSRTLLVGNGSSATSTANNSFETVVFGCGGGGGSDGGSNDVAADCTLPRNNRGAILKIYISKMFYKYFHMKFIILQMFAFRKVAMIIMYIASPVELEVTTFLFLVLPE